MTLIKTLIKGNTSSFEGQPDGLRGVLDTAWSLIGAGVRDRSSAFHLPTIASISAEGLPVMRTVVLRGVDVTQRLLRFHADRRSAKISELSAHPQITLHFYDASIKTQIRLEATAKLHVEDPLAAAAWEASWPVSRLCYAADIVPGVEVASPPAAPTAKDAEKNDGFGNFCLVIAAVHRLEWLHLAATGHQRAAFDWTGAECPSTRWLAP